MKRKYIIPVIKVIDDDGVLLVGSNRPDTYGDGGGGAGDDGTEGTNTSTNDETNGEGFVDGAKGTGLEWDFDW